MKKIIKIKTWSCGCGYHQDCEPTQENQNLHFNSDPKFRVSNLTVNQCPACALKGVVGTLSIETDPNKKVTITIMGEDELDAHEIEDKNGKRKLSAQEKEQYRTKIRADIAKYQALED